MTDTPGRVVYRLEERADFAEILSELRVARGWTCADLDHRAGFHDGYVGKLEHPDTKTGRKGLRFVPDGDSVSAIVSAMADVWMTALGVELLIVDRETAASLDPRPAPKRTARRPNISRPVRMQPAMA